MALDRRRVGLFCAAALLRCLLFVVFPSLSDLLAGRVELSTPVTSFKRCKGPSLEPYIPRKGSARARYIRGREGKEKKEGHSS
jgi:hypothetical protein